MAVKKHKGTSPGKRGTKSIKYGELLSGDKKGPLKSKTKGGKRSVGRSSQGKITTRHKGGGHKRRYRNIDWKFDKRDIPARIDSVEYDPNRSGFIALLVYADGEKRYILAPAEMKAGDKILVSENAAIETGNRLPLKAIPAGTFVYNVEIKPGGGAKLIRSAGNQALVLARDAGYVTLKMPSSEVRKVHEDCWASVGSVSNTEHNLVVLGKAGRNRWKGVRPTVRGSAMNPVDHPHGGGEGRAGRGRRRAVSPTGKNIGKGHKTRRPKKYSNKFIVTRRKVGKRK